MSKHHTPATRPQSAGQYGRCFETHPPLPIGEFLIYGGSCSRPMVNNADIYVGFDHSMAITDKKWPWVEGESFLYPIQDMGTPSDVDSFRKLVEWLAVQLTAHKLVHIGCIGGHGRTGLVLAALVTHMTGEKDSITYVRKHYCEKAVESTSQVRFLNQHFGITEVDGAKAKPASYDDWYKTKGYPVASNPVGKKKSEASASASLPKGGVSATSVVSPLCIWGDTVSFVKPKKCDTIVSI